MRNYLLPMLAFLVLCGAVVASQQADGDKETKKKNPNLGKLRHVVLFAWKEDTPEAKIREIEKAFAALQGKIPSIIDFEWGTNNSPEGLANGFTHCFLVTFEDEAGRKAYLPHPAHRKFVELIGPHMEKVLVVDYFAEK